MRFFTMAWWSGVQTEDDGDPATDYAAHLSAIRELLPPDLLDTEESVSLHDTRLRQLRLLLTDGSLELGLESYAGDGWFTLMYGGVELFESEADPRTGLSGPSGYGDLGYCEIDVLPEGRFEHRLLFSTGIELRVTFQSFRLQQGKHDLPGNPS
jgi:hypothetical protein